MRLRPIQRPLKRFVQVGARRRALVVEALACLLAARLALIVVPFPRLARILGTFVPPSDARAVRTASPQPQDAWLAGEIGWAVTRSARWAPFRAVCLPQAMAAQFMLRRRGVASIMRFGAGRGAEKSFDSHAWLDAAGVEVTGYPLPQSLVEIACFV